MSSRPFRAVILTISDSAFRHEREDRSGPMAVEFVVSVGGEVVRTEILPDDRSLIASRLSSLADAGNVELILTTGGTGFARRDVTPEATRDAIEREAPGLAELMRRETSKITPLAPLSRAVCGLRGSTLIVNLPGSPKGVRECLDVLQPLLLHGLMVLTGEITQHLRDGKLDA